MSILNIEKICSFTYPRGTCLGLDLGSKTIGIAISDKGWQFANPRPVIIRKKFSKDVEKLLNIIEKDEVHLIVIGLPINMDGTSGPRAQATRAFVRNMELWTQIPFLFWDERLSTFAAERYLLEMDVSRAKRSQRIDSAAAAFILQGALDRFSSLKKSYNG